jgi:hypothetical protein
MESTQILCNHVLVEGNTEEANMPKPGADRDVNPLAIAKEKCNQEVTLWQQVFGDGQPSIEPNSVRGQIALGFAASHFSLLSLLRAREVCVQNKLKEQKGSEASHLPPLVLEKAPKLRK